VFAVVERLDADILVLPETWIPHTGDGVVEQLRASGYDVALDRWATLKHGRFKPRLATPGDGWWALAVASRLPVRARRELRLAPTRSDPAEPRVAIEMTVDVGGTLVDAVAVHTSSRLWWGAPVMHINSLRAQLGVHERPAFLAGDFNLWGPAVERLLPGWRRAVKGRTYPSHRPHSQIDHVLVNEHITVVDAQIVDNRQSDHRPVRVRLRA
jgi:endonuclease/exonuclease/phosphatase family metal-dependent hydrolase